MRTNFPEYVVALATIVELVIFSIFDGVGITCLPLGLIFSFLRQPIAIITHAHYIMEALSKVVNEAEGEDLERVNACDPVRIAVSVETIMFEELGRSNGAQKFKYRSIMLNLKDGNDPDLRRGFHLGKIKPEKLIFMTAEEMASDNRKLENKQIKDKALFECERGMKPKATMDQFKCGKCGQRMCTYYQLQTRSADEPTTTFYTCVNCNNHWKFC